MQKNFKQTKYIVYSLVAAFTLYACKSSTNNAGYGPPPPETLPVITISKMQATTHQEFSASLEGSKDIEVRPEVEGYIERIYVDEGAHVRKGQMLFQINSRTYSSQLNNGLLSLQFSNFKLCF